MYCIECCDIIVKRIIFLKQMSFFIEGHLYCKDEKIFFSQEFGSKMYIHTVLCHEHKNTKKWRRGLVIFLSKIPSKGVSFRLLNINSLSGRLAGQGRPNCRAGTIGLINRTEMPNATFFALMKHFVALPSLFSGWINYFSFYSSEVY